MDSSQIINEMKFAKYFKGVFPRDCLKMKLKSYPFGIIVNTDSSQGRGEHWVAIFLNEYKRGEYFDSFGLPPLHIDFVSFLDTNCSDGWIFNSCGLQHYQSKKCGQFCIAFLKAREKGQSFAEFINQFSVNLAKNDEILDKLI